MIESFFLQLTEFWKWLLPFLQTLIWPSVAFGAILLAARIVAFKSEPDVARKITSQSRVWGKVAIVLLVTGTLATFHRAAMTAVEGYREKQIVKRFDSKEVVAGTAVNQSMPSILLFEKKVVKNRMFMSAENVAMYRTVTDVDFAGYAQSISGNENPKILKATPSPGGGFVLEVELELSEPHQVTLEKSTINLNLDPVQDADPRANAYALSFDGTYTWTNATASPADTQFQLSLPDHGGILESVTVKFDGVEATGSNDSGEITYRATAKPGQSVTARVTYNTKGRGNFRFYPSQGLRTISELELNLSSSADVRFERGSIVASKLGQGKYRWQMKNAVTRQYVSIAIPYARGTQELWWKLGYMAPFALFGFIAVLSLSGGLDLPLRTLLGALLVQAVGTGLPLAFPNFDVSPILLGLVGAGLSAGTTFAILGRAHLLAISVGTCLYLSAIAGNSTSLVLLIVFLGVGLAFGKVKPLGPTQPT